MSDVFNLPLKSEKWVVYSEPHHVEWLLEAQVDELECGSEREALHVACAINNHDKLVEALKVNHEWLSINSGYIGSPLCEKNIALLKELGHEI